MTSAKLSFVALFGLLVFGVTSAMPSSSADAFTGIGKPAVEGDQTELLDFVDGGSWKRKKSFNSRSHFRGGRSYGRFDDSKFRGFKKKKHHRFYRNGYRRGYFDGRRDSRFSGGVFSNRRHLGFKRGYRDFRGKGRFGGGGSSFYFRF